MLKRKILKYSIYAIAILSATLINQLIVDYIKPEYSFTWLFTSTCRYVGGTHYFYPCFHIGF